MSERRDASVRLQRRIFDLVANVTGYLPGELKDWPPQIQDQIYEAMERLMKRKRLKRVHIQASRCGRDLPDEPYHVVVTICDQEIRLDS